MRNNLFFLVGVSCVASASIASADGPSITRAPTVMSTVDVDNADVVPFKKRLAIRRANQAKLLAVASSDPRTEAAKADLIAASQILDRSQRLAALKAAGVKWQGLRADLLKKAAVDPAALNAQLGLLPVVRTAPLALALPAAPTSTTTTVGAFPEQYTYKYECSDGSDKWTFNGERTSTYASSTPTSEDCTTVRAGKGAKIEVPAGTKSVEITVDWVYELDVDAVTHGIYGSARAATGVRFESLAGVPLGQVDTPQGKKDVPIRFDGYLSIAIECGLAPFCGDAAEGTARKTYTLPVDHGAILVTPYVQSSADADLISVAMGSARIKDVRPMKVKFNR